ncbi:hypothetical protein QTP86_001015 [Hemibagrus guttatus]|nr:hypothetical protein QTP86_001015 [Hemibagrus guttatus]
MIQKRRRFLWAKAHLKWTVAKWKTVLWSDESKFEVLFGKLGRHVIRTKEDKDNPSCYQRSVQKPASLMGCGGSGAYPANTGHNADSRSAHVSVGGVAPQCSFRGGRCLTRRQRRRVWQHPAPALPPLGEFQFPARQTSSPRSRRSSVDIARCECSAVDVARSCCSAVDVAWSCGSAVDVIRLCGSAVDVIRLCGSAVDLVRRLRSAVDVASDPLALPSGPGRLAVINGTMNSAVYQKILKENVRPSVCDLKLKRTWVLQQDNDPKHTSKSTSEWLKKNKMKTLEWPSQSPDLNLIEMLWHDLKKVVHARKPSNVAELQQFCKDEWAKIPPQRCNRLIASYQKRFIAVVASKAFHLDSLNLSTAGDAKTLLKDLGVNHFAAVKN